MPLVDVLVRRAKAGAVETVMVGGAVASRQGAFAKVDRQAVLAEIAGTLAQPGSAAEAERRRLAGALMGPVRDFYRGWV